MPPDASFPPFLASRKGVALRPDLKKTGMAGCPRIKNAVLLKKPSMRGHPLLPELQLVATKGSKYAAGSFAPGLPENVPIFSS